MPLRQLEQLFRNSLLRRYEKGQILLHAGDKLTNIYFLKRGFVKMYSINEQGEERILMIFSPNTVFPNVNVADNSDYEVQYFYQAMTKIELYQLSHAEFTEVLKRNDEVARLVLEYVTDFAGDLVGRLRVIEGKDAKTKISASLRYLIKVCSKEISPDQFRISLKITHQDIASLTGLTRETASVQVKVLEDEGALEQRKDGRLVINEQLIPV